jgi:hypothetical protein
MLSDAEVLEELTGAGGTIADYFFIGESFFCINSRGMLLGVAADDELCVAMAAYLRRKGVPEYASEDEARRLQKERRTESCT